MRYFKDEKRNGSYIWSVFVMAVMMLSISATGAVVPSTEAEQRLQLKPGWNLVTLTRPLDSMSGNIDLFLKLKPIEFDVKSNTYKFCSRPEDIKVGVGYWIFCKESKKESFSLDNTQTVVQPTLKAGWNLVGMTDGATWPQSAEVIWEWKNGRFVVVKDTKLLEKGKGYWAFINK